MRVLVSSARAFHNIYGIKYDEIKRFRPGGGREPGRAAFPRGAETRPWRRNCGAVFIFPLLVGIW